MGSRVDDNRVSNGARMVSGSCKYTGAEEEAEELAHVIGRACENKATGEKREGRKRQAAHQNQSLAHKCLLHASECLHGHMHATGSASQVASGVEARAYDKGHLL